MFDFESIIKKAKDMGIDVSKLLDEVFKLDVVEFLRAALGNPLVKPYIINQLRELSDFMKREYEISDAVVETYREDDGVVVEATLFMPEEKCDVFKERLLNLINTISQSDKFKAAKKQFDLKKIECRKTDDGVIIKVVGNEKLEQSVGLLLEAFGGGVGE